MVYLVVEEVLHRKEGWEVERVNLSKRRFKYNHIISGIEIT